MSDVFISYSKPDLAIARLLAAFLSSEGYSVWWDSNLLSGEEFRPTIRRELGEAKAVIVIWSKNSIRSDWVLSEAERARRGHKLIPVKAGLLAYEDIPAPFDNLHIEPVDNRQKILAAVAALVARPASIFSERALFSQHFRYALLSWLGILGAAITIGSNLQGLITLSTLARQLFEAWKDIITWFWRHLLFFLANVATMDALVLTFGCFLLVNFASSLTTRKTTEKRVHILSALIAFLTIFVIFLRGGGSLKDDAEGGVYIKHDEVDGDGMDLEALREWRFLRGTGDFFNLIYDQIEFLHLPREDRAEVALVLMFVVAFVILASVFAIIVRFFWRPSVSFRSLAFRLWSILALIATLATVNLFLGWIESHHILAPRAPPDWSIDQMKPG